MQFDYFQMVDRLETLDLEAREIRCLAEVPAQSTVFEGHFPGPENADPQLPRLHAQGAAPSSPAEEFWPEPTVKQR